MKGHVVRSKDVYGRGRRGKEAKIRISVDAIIERPLDNVDFVSVAGIYIS